ncbi:MAG: nucleotidyltransferase domain-containing protein [Deltaproteobacteria bacterium]|nr:nucleotidyltransferase domain-containing protein [Deltaproteobacteria bacterium]
MGGDKKPLAALDPREVPLPNGTEVTTRVDRALGDRRVPQGAVGRVLSSDGLHVEVRIVGVGPVSYTRDELLPRKIGQARFAARRAASWAALAPCVVIEATVGSRAWGLSDEGSDVDRRGVFALPFPWSVGLAKAPSDLVSADASTTYWEVRKAIEQALRADPNTLEMLFVGSAVAKDEIGERILAARSAFVSREIYGSFGRYALSQLGKLTQSLRLAEHRTMVLEWLRADPDLTLDATAVRLARACIRDRPSEKDAILRAKEYIKQLYRSLYDQGLIRERAFPALAELAGTEVARFELPRELRPKNAYNLLRLIHTAIDWLETGEPHLETEGALRSRLLAIKRGEVPLADVLAEAEAMTPALERARQITRLPPQPSYAVADALLRSIATELARRHLAAEPGPFGRDAPPPPAVDMDAEGGAAPDQEGGDDR